MSIRTLIASLAVPVGAVAVAACGSSAGTPSGAPAPPPGTSAPAGTSSPPAAGSVLVKTASVGRLGTVAVDGQGMTVYLFAADSNKPPASHCDGACAKYWPPLLAGPGSPTAQGVPASLLGTVTRSDGTKQVTLGGWPLYTYVGDHAPGDANGQGLNASGGTWWAVTSTGQKDSGSAPPPAGSSSGSTGGGYGGY
ncbi:hypothetical protein KGA66_20000 [Actinocrinis puniceicyclus]|uniref:Lipoprotein with Yx(FWY)xxD motif n=1 Tax=Actinocrinis puniceicyclus TaxID=977794 RepID=A0A8J7WUF5_9ACTN|nr:hypothetical protein [Actinocrinis puniceicyclus]MBS2965344.1 hypothetical protein [Actinocrinis puniceicyclus]